MALIVNSGLDDIARYVLGLASTFGLTVHLYGNVWTPTYNDTTANYSECGLPGYAAVSLSPSNWTGSTVGGVASYHYPTLNFSFGAYSGGASITGYYVTNTAKNDLVWAEQFSQPFAVPAAGGSLALNITWTDANC